MSLTKSYIAQGAIAAYRICKAGTADRAVSQAGAATDKFFGVSVELSVVDGERVDVQRTGLPLVQFGGAVDRGDPLTSDAQGRAIKANPAPGTRMAIIGFAEVSAVAGDIESMLIAPGFITTPA